MRLRLASPSPKFIAAFPITPAAAHISRRHYTPCPASHTVQQAGQPHKIQGAARAREHIHSRKHAAAPRAMATTSTSALSAAEQANLVESSKRAAAYEAVKEHMDLTYTHVGIGSGSTVIYVVEAIAALGRDVTSRMAFFPTGEQSRELIRGAGLNLQYVQDLPEGQQLDVCFDGADEVDEELNLIKGGGACLFQEKLIVTKAKKFVCVAGEWGGRSFPPPVDC